MHIDLSKAEDAYESEQEHRFVEIDIKEQFALLKKEANKRKESGRESAC